MSSAGSLNGSRSAGAGCYSSVEGIQPRFFGSHVNFEILVCVIKCDHDKRDGKDEEDPDGGHHGRDAPPRPSANPSKSPLECSLRTFETHPRCCQVDALVATSSSSSGPVDQSRGSCSSTQL